MCSAGRCGEFHTFWLSVTRIKNVQCSCLGWPTGNGNKLSNTATAKHVAWPSCARLLLSIFPFPLGHPEHEHCTVWRPVWPVIPFPV